MLRFCRILNAIILIASAAGGFVGCGITRSTDTARTATEQLLVTDAIDRAIESMNLQPLAGQSIFLDDSKVTDAVDRNYYISTLRQHLLANGCQLKDKREDADFVVEARAGAIGTDRNDLLFGIPTTQVPAIPLIQPLPSTIPEVPLAKRKDQRGIAKLALFAYHRATGKPVWQSGIVRQESSANDVWLFGAGPFQHGTIYEDVPVASAPTNSGKAEYRERSTRGIDKMKVAREMVFNTPEQLAQKPAATGTPDKAVVLASHEQPAAPPKPVAGIPAAPIPKPAATPASSATASIASPKKAEAAPAAAQPKQENKQTAGTPATTGKVSAMPPARSSSALNAAYAGLGVSNSNKPIVESPR